MLNIVLGKLSFFETPCSCSDNPATGSLFVGGVGLKAFFKNAPGISPGRVPWVVSHPSAREMLEASLSSAGHPAMEYSTILMHT